MQKNIRAVQRPLNRQARINFIRHLRAQITQIEQRRADDADAITRKLGRIAELQEPAQAVSS